MKLRVSRIVLNVRESRATLYRLIDLAAESHQPAYVMGKRSGAVLLFAEDWQAIEERL